MDTHRSGLILLSLENFDDVDFINPRFDDYKEAKSITQEEILVYLANLENDTTNGKIHDALKRCFIIRSNELSVEEYVNSAFGEFEKIAGVDIARIIMLDWENRDNSNPCNTIEDAKIMLEKSFELACSTAASYVMAICCDFDNDFNSMPKTATMINLVESYFRPTIRYIPIPAISKKTGEIMYCDGYCVYSVLDAIYLHFVNAVKNRIRIKQCKICGNYFIPTSKRDEIYCRVCRKTTYDTKIQNDNILKAYRTIYKTQNARKQRNSHIQNINYRFDCWKENAKVIVELCQSGKLTVEEMKHLISSDSWIKGIFPDLQ